MDPISQGVLGAAVAGSASKRDTIKIAAFCGAVGGLAPDLDIFIRSENDPLLFLEYHRHFTHSLAFIPIGGLLVALILKLVSYRRGIDFLTIYIFTTLGFATHGFLDACTSYGTRLYWPFLDLRVAWNIVSIIDPVFTFTLLIFCILSLVRKSKILMRVGLSLAMLYLAYGVYQHEKVKNIMYQEAETRGHGVDRILLNPTIGNNILWRSVYQSGNKYYIDAVYIAPFSNPIIREGTIVNVIDKETIFPEIPSYSILREDIRRFSYFSQDYIYIYPKNENIIGDLRYGSLPYNDQTLWGIKLDPNSPNQHARHVNLRNFRDKHYDEFWLMLGGKMD